MEPQKSQKPLSRERLIYRKFRLLAERIGIGELYLDVDTDRIRPLAEVKQYVGEIENNIESGKGLVLTGGFGAGKTTILSYIARKAFEVGKFEGVRDGEKFIPMRYVQKYDIRFSSVHNLIQRLMDGKAGQYQKSDLLLLDDFGWEYSHKFPASHLLNFMEYRYSHRLATCVTTNLSVEQLKKSDTYAHLVDRWRDKKVYQVIQVAGRSQR